MATPLAELVEDRNDWGGQLPQLVETTSGWTGRQHYLIHTRNMDEADTATNLPRRGQSWSGSRRNLRVTKRAINIIGGEVDVDSQFKGYCWCDVEYSTDGLGGSLPAPVLGTTWSEFRPSVGTFHRKADARITSPALTDFAEIPLDIAAAFTDGRDEAIANGSGMQAAYGTMQIVVSKFINPDTLDIGRLNELQSRQAVNREIVTCPPLLNSHRRWFFDPGQLRYVTFGLSYDRTEFRIDHVMEMARNHLFFWAPEDKDGRPIDGRPSYFNVIYPAMSFAGIF